MKKHSFKKEKKSVNTQEKSSFFINNNNNKTQRMKEKIWLIPSNLAVFYKHRTVLHGAMVPYPAPHIFISLVNSWHILTPEKVAKKWIS